MSVESPFESDGVWLRCALHAHSTNSDGELAPARLAAHYAGAGYDVLCITDHWFRTSVPDAAGILVIPGVELNATIESTGNEAHVLGVGIKSDPPSPPEGWPYATEYSSLRTTVDWIREAGGLAFLAHPYWSGLRGEEFADCDGLVGVEVFNAGCEYGLGRGLSSVQWDDALEAGARFTATAADDSHLPGFDSAFGSVWLRATERSRDGVLDALSRGCFYSSTGPRIEHVRVTESFVEVRCTPAASVTLVSARTAGARANTGRMGWRWRVDDVVENEEELVVGVRLQRRGPDRMPYGRVEVTDTRGRRAWTNPLWLPER